MAVAAPARTLLRTRWVVAACALLALALRAPFFSAALGRDEGGIAFIARQWPGGHGSLYGAYWLDRPPLLLALFKLAITGGVLGVRALGAAAAVALVGLAAALAGALGGHRAARAAAVLTAVMASSIALAAVFTPSELLASVPAAASVGCLVLAHRNGRARAVAAAGALAMTALLIKQSFIDAGVAGAVFLALSHGRRRAFVPAYAGGALVPLVAALAGLKAMGGSISGLAYALVGFRISALGTLSASSVPLQQRVLGLERPAIGSALLLTLVLAPFGLRRLRDRRLIAVLGAWLLAGVAGVLAGGSYWPHYLIQLVVPAAVLASLLPRRYWVALPVAVAIGFTVAGAQNVHAHPRHGKELAIAHYIRAHARPGDTQYVMYARANLDYLDGLPSPYPYAWSLMVRGIPGATARLDRLLASPRRPTWVVGWQSTQHWGLDPHHVTYRLLRAHYRRVARIGGHPVWHRLT